ncbi:MAG TPA: hypothetical protein PLE74_10970, partial [Candidatus Cloacimonadota bacterium]|nr:hypothetical protein [Candidatus Cloacimonadota bacterium]
MYKYIITLFILFLSFNLFSQDHHYHAICVDSLQVPYEYNSYKQNADGSITFYQISSTLNDIHFNKFTLSQDLAFSDLETFYTDQIDYSIYTYHNHVFNNDYFYIHSWHGDMCYVFNNDQLISILDYHSNYLPIDSNHIIYYSSSKIYKINISTNEIDSLSFGTYNGIVGLLPYTDHQFLVKHDYDMYHSNILVINEDLTVSDTVTVNEDVQVDIFDQLVFNPYHATIYQHDNYTLITAQNYYLEGGTALIVLNVEHQIVYANSPVGEYHDFIDLDPNSVAFLFHSDGL